ncbi:hypothetical protein, partial [Ornithobacterium rhinotracheale]
MTEATSLQEEFNKVNNNAAATWQKIKNAFSEFFSSGEFFHYFEGIIQLMGAFVGVTDDAEKKGENLRKRLQNLAQWVKTLAVAWVSYISISKLLLLWRTKNIAAIVGESTALKLQAYWTKITTAADLLLTAAKAKLTGNTLQANLAMATFNKTVKLNPIGLLVSVLIAAIFYLKDFANATDAATQKQKLLNSVQAEAEKNTISQKNELELLLKVARDETQAKEDRIAAIKKLNEISPEYLGNLSLETINTQEATKAVNDYIDSLNRKAYAEALQSKRTELYKKQVELQHKTHEDYGEWHELGNAGIAMEAFMNGLRDTGNQKNADFKALDKLNKEEREKALKRLTPILRDRYARYRAEFSQTEEELKALDEMQKKFIEEDKKNMRTALGLDNGNNNKNQVVSTTKTKKTKPNRVGKDRAAEKLANEIKREGDAALKAEEQALKNLQKAEDDAWDLKHETAEEGMEKELQLLDKQKERKLRRLKEEATELGQKKNEFEEKIAELNAQKAKASGTQKEAINKSIAHYQKAIEQLENIAATHGEREKAIAETAEQKKLKVREQYLKKAIDQEKKAFENKQKDAYL